MRGRTQRLIDQYDDLNRRYFGGHLPRVPVWSCRLPDLEGQVVNDARGRAKMVKIKRDLRRNPEKERQVLLHEMVHIWAGDLCGVRHAHGKRWKNRMLQLAKQGEPWAADEVEHYLTGLRRHALLSDLTPEQQQRALVNPTTWQQRALANPTITWNDNIVTLKNGLRDLAFDSRVARSFGLVRTIAAEIMLIDVADVPKKLPWLKGAWRNALREAAYEGELRRLFDSGANLKERKAAHRRIMRKRFIR